MANAALPRQKRCAEIDPDNMAEELEPMGGSEQRELLHRLAVLPTHLQKGDAIPQVAIINLVTVIMQWEC